jgi:hypothetical protein
MIAGALCAQAKDNLAILPFTGGVGDEGEAIAEELSFDEQLKTKFGIMPRTSIASALEKEQSFQHSSGMTDVDTIAAIGQQSGAKYVMAGNITALGSQKLLVVTIIRIETIQQVAGAYLTYNRSEELPAKFPDMMKNLLPLLDVDTSGLQKLAVVPIQMQGGATNQRDADTLAQILAISLLQNKKYAIYPRTSSLEQVQKEFDTQVSGVTADENQVRLGYGVNPEYVLSVVSRKLGASNMFNAAVIDLAAGTMADGMSEKYGTLTDGITAMESIAKTLSEGKMSGLVHVDKDNLAILPFTGGVGDEGDTIAELLSFDKDLLAKFGIIPRTGIASAIAQEQGFQTTSGMTDADTIAALGAQLGAKYVMAGSITELGSQKLLVVTIVRIETIQQVSGDYLTYNRIDDLPAKFPDMMKNLLPLLDVDTSDLQKLAVVPIQMQGGATNQRDADTLAQILAIYLLRNKKYAIYPRTSSLEQVQKEFDTQRGVTADENQARLGDGVNPEYVLSVISRKLGEMNRFNASIIDLTAGIQIEGMSEQYRTLNDGFAAMSIIAKGLSGGDITIERQQREQFLAEEARAEAERIAEAERAKARAEAERQEAQRLAEEREKLLSLFQLGAEYGNEDIATITPFAGFNYSVGSTVLFGLSITAKYRISFDGNDNHLYTGETLSLRFKLFGNSLSFSPIVTNKNYFYSGESSNDRGLLMPAAILGGRSGNLSWSATFQKPIQYSPLYIDSEYNIKVMMEYFFGLSTITSEYQWFSSPTGIQWYMADEKEYLPYYSTSTDDLNYLIAIRLKLNIFYSMSISVGYTTYVVSGSTFSDITLNASYQIKQHTVLYTEYIFRDIRDSGNNPNRFLLGLRYRF